MIKTVAFAPPRSAHSHSSAKSVAAKPEMKPVLAATKPRSTSYGAASGSSSPENSVSTKMPTKTSPKKSASKTEVQTSLDLFSTLPDEVSPLTPAKSAPPKKIKLPISAPNTSTGPQAEDSGKTEIKSTEIKAEPKVKAEVKAKKVRVPKDLAAQYGEKTAVRPAAMTPIEAESPKKRLSKAERQARRDLMKPSEGLMERLARANQITLRKPASEPRSKGWKFSCGRCGAISYFQTPGGLCACGTIALKE